jgi:hypothetical protein
VKIKINHCHSPKLVQQPSSACILESGRQVSYVYLSPRGILIPSLLCSLKNFNQIRIIDGITVLTEHGFRV